MIITDHFDKGGDKRSCLSLGFSVPLAELGFLLDQIFGKRRNLSRDNLDENGATIWMRRGSRADG